MFKAALWLLVLAGIGVTGYYMYFAGSEGFGSVRVGNKVFSVEIADSPEERTKGLSGRFDIGRADGMLFVFPSAAQYEFWMKDMKFSLDILWIAGDRVIGFENAVPPAEPGDESPTTYRAPEAVQYVLELPAGSVERYNIDRGQSVTVTLPRIGK